MTATRPRREARWRPALCPLTFTLMLTLLTASSCSSPGHRSPRPAAVTSSGCGMAPSTAPGTTAPASVAVPPASATGMSRREYRLHVPRGYNPRRAVPLILAFHGAGGTSTGMESQSGLSRWADRLGFLVAYPQGVARPGTSGQAGWAASGPSDPDAHGVDEGLFVNRVIDQVESAYCVDTLVVGATGFSNGAGLVGYLGCALAGRITAISPVEGEFFQITRGCVPRAPVSVLDVHVFTDPVAPYGGTPARGSPDYYATAIPDWVRQWARRDGCREQPVTLFASAAQMGQEWSACDQGTTVAAYRIATGGHTWPARLGAREGGRAIARFLLDHPRGAAGTQWAPHPAAAPVSAPEPVLAVTSSRQYRVPTPGSEPVDLAVGPGGYLWFTEFHGNKIGRIDPAGHLQEFPVPSPNAEPYLITAGPDGNMWFTEYNTAKLGRVTPDGQVTEISLPPWSAGGLGIASGNGPWIADPAGSVDRVVPGHRPGRYPLPARTGTPFAMAATDSTGVWVSQFSGFFDHAAVLEHLLPDGTLRTVTLPDPTTNVDSLTIDRAGNLWFTDFGTNRIGSLSAAGKLTWIAFPLPDAGLNDITPGTGDVLWCTAQDGLVARLDATGRIQAVAIQPASSEPDGIAVSPDGTVWVADTGANQITALTAEGG